MAEHEDSISVVEKNYLRELAKKQLEYANLPVMKEREKLWYAHNAVGGERPIVLMEHSLFLDDILPASQCESAAAKEMERALLTQIVNHEWIDDDKVIPTHYVVGLDVWSDTYGVPMERVFATDSTGHELGYRDVHPISDLEKDFPKLRHSMFYVDRARTQTRKAQAEDTIGDILPVVVKNESLVWSVPPSEKVVHLMGLEAMMCAMICYDWEMEVYHLSYFRSESRSHIPLPRYLLPHAPLMTAVTGFNDRNMINQCLLYRYIVSYEPYNFKGRLDDYPLTMEYGKNMDGLRTELRDYFWDGEFRDTVGAKVTGQNGEPHKPYSVFVNRNNNRSGIIVCNYDNHTIKVVVSMDDGSTLEKYRLVDNAAWKDVRDGIEIPPQSAALVV